MPERRQKVPSPLRGRGLGRVLRTWALAELAAYFVLAIIATWPLARYGASSLPLGTESAATVPLLNLWTIWWNADRAQHLYHGYWDAPIFAPTPGTFAFSEPMPTSVIVAPLVWFGGHRVLAYNGFLLVALTLNGWSAFRLLRAVRLRWLACALGGGLVEMLPLVHSELGTLQMVPLCGIVWTIHALVLFGRRPGWKASILLAAAFAATYLTCAYYGLFLSLVLLPSGLWLVGKRLRQGRTWGLLLGSAGTALLLITPVVAAQLRVIRTHDLRRSQDWVARLSADLRDYAVTPWPQRFEPEFLTALRPQRYFRLGPGWLKLGLAVLGLAAGCWWRRYRRWTAFCVTMLAAAFLLSFGPRLSWNGWSPYGLLMDWYPGMAQARNVYRFAVFVQLALVFLATFGLQAILTRFRRPGWSSLQARDSVVDEVPQSARDSKFCMLREGWVASRPHLSSQVGWAVIVALGVLAATEAFPPSQPLFRVPSPKAQANWIHWLKSQTSDDSVIACVPFPTGTRVQDYEDTTIWMYWGTYHQRRVANGYSGFFPQSFLDTKAVMRNFPDDTSKQRLRQLGVTYCVIQSGAVTQNVAKGNWLELAFRDDTAQVNIYRVGRDGSKVAP